MIVVVVVVVVFWVGSGPAVTPFSQSQAGLTVSAQIHSASYEDANASKAVEMYVVPVLV